MFPNRYIAAILVTTLVIIQLLYNHSAVLKRPCFQLIKARVMMVAIYICQKEASKHIGKRWSSLCTQSRYTYSIDFSTISGFRYKWEGLKTCTPQIQTPHRGMSPCNSHNNSMESVVVSSPFYRKWDLSKRHIEWMTSVMQTQWPDSKDPILYNL